MANTCHVLTWISNQMRRVQMNTRQQMKLRQDFTNRQPGDVIQPLGNSKFVVLRNGPEDNKILGQICGCGQHVILLPFYVKWSEEEFAPVTLKGRPVFPTWKGVSIDKGARPDLATKYQHVLVDDDFTHPSMEERVEKFIEDNTEKVEEAIETFGRMEADDSVKMIGMLRALGITISDEQACFAIKIMEGNREFDQQKHMTVFFDTVAFDSLFPARVPGERVR